MKIRLLIVFVFLFTEFFTQNSVADREIHNKYWNMRSRLRNDFMKVGPGPGESIPMQERGYLYYPYFNDYGNFVFPNSASGQRAQWGDAMGDLGYYIGVLATEYALLAINNQPKDSVIKELFYALGAINRMDLQAEANFSLAKNQTFQPSLNGFMVRDDIPGESFITNNLSHFNYYGNRGFKSKIFINKLAGCAGVYSKNGNKKLDENNNEINEFEYEGSYISQDNWYNVLVGLSLVRRFIPPGVAFLNASNNPVNIHGGDPANFSDAALAIGNRVYNYMKDGFTTFNLDWNLEYPNGDNIGSDWGGYSMPMCYAHAEALNKMENFDYGYKTYGASTHFNNECDWNDWIESADTKIGRAWRRKIASPAQQLTYNLYPHFSGSHLHPSLAYENSFIAQLGSFWGSQDVAVMGTNLAGISNCVYEYKGNKTKHNQSIRITSDGMFHGDLLRMAIHGWGSCFDNAFVQSSFDYSYSLLQSAPCEGPFNFKSSNPDVPGVGWAGPVPLSGEWSTTSRLDHLQRRNSNHTFLGEYNGLDYMLYHNLYYLTKYQSDPTYVGCKVVDLTSRELKIDYPTSINGSPWGSSSNPAFVPSHEYIVATNKLNPGASASYQAGKVIYLKKGFKASAGSTFRAYIHTDFDFCDYNHDFSNPVNPSVNGRMNSHSDSSKFFSTSPTSYVKSNQMDDNTVSELHELKKKENMIKLVQNIKSISIKSQITKVYPNPSSGTFNIFIDEPSNYSSVTVIDVLNQLVFEMNTINSLSTVDLSNNTKGVYFVLFKLKNGSINTTKIIIN